MVHNGLDPHHVVGINPEPMMFRKMFDNLAKLLHDGIADIRTRFHMVTAEHFTKLLTQSAQYGIRGNQYIDRAMGKERKAYIRRESLHGTHSIVISSLGNERKQSLLYYKIENTATPLFPECQKGF